MKQHLLREDSFLINIILKCKLADKVANPNLLSKLLPPSTCMRIHGHPMTNSHPYILSFIPLIPHLHMSPIDTTIPQAILSALCTGNTIQRLSYLAILNNLD